MWRFVFVAAGFTLLGLTGCGESSCDLTGCPLPAARITIHGLSADDAPWDIALCGSSGCTSFVVGATESKHDLYLSVTTSMAAGKNLMVVEDASVEDGEQISLTIKDRTGATIFTDDELVELGPVSFGAGGCARTCREFAVEKSAQ
jgi:hypothetical protein